MSKIQLNGNPSLKEVYEKLRNVKEDDIREVLLNDKNKLVVIGKLAKYNLVLKTSYDSSFLDVKFAGWNTGMLVFAILTAILIFVAFIGIVPLIIIWVMYSGDHKRVTRIIVSYLRVNKSFDSNNADKYEQLEKLKSLKDRGAISELEFEKEKSKLLQYQ